MTQVEHTTVYKPH